MLEDIKFRRIEKMLLRELTGSFYKVNDKLESENALMKRFNVSKVTIRAALKRLEDSGIILCEHGKRRVLLRKPDDMSRIRSGMNFGVFMRNEYLTENNDLLGVSQGLAEGLRKWNADLTILPISGKISELEFVKRVVGRNMIDGLFMTGMEEGMAIMDYLKDIDFPCVSFDFMECGENNGKSFPHVKLREASILNSFASKFQKVLVVGSHGHSLDRTRDLLDAALPFDIKPVNVDSCEREIEKILDSLIDEELLLVASLDVLSLLDWIARRSPKRDLSKNVLVFKHCPVDLSRYQGRYLLFDRPMTKIGESAAGLMRKAILNRNDKEFERNEEVVVIDATIKLI